MTNFNRRLCQDYTDVAVKLTKLNKQNYEKNLDLIKGIALLLGIFLAFCLAGSLTYPY